MAVEHRSTQAKRAAVFRPYAGDESLAERRQTQLCAAAQRPWRLAQRHRERGLGAGDEQRRAGNDLHSLGTPSWDMLVKGADALVVRRIERVWHSPGADETVAVDCCENAHALVDISRDGKVEHCRACVLLEQEACSCVSVDDPDLACTPEELSPGVSLDRVCGTTHPGVSRRRRHGARRQCDGG